VHLNDVPQQPTLWNSWTGFWAGGLLSNHNINLALPMALGLCLASALTVTFPRTQVRGFSSEEY